MAGPGRARCGHRYRPRGGGVRGLEGSRAPLRRAGCGDRRARDAPVLPARSYGGSAKPEPLALAAGGAGFGGLRAWRGGGRAERSALREEEGCAAAPGAPGRPACTLGRGSRVPRPRRPCSLWSPLAGSGDSPGARRGLAVSYCFMS